MSGYSGSPIFPADDPYAAQPQQPQQSQQPQQWGDAEATTMMPPVPPLPQMRDEAQPPPVSRFGQIHEKYATTEVPLPPELLQPQQSAPAWPEHWEQPAAAPAGPTAPPVGWQPAPQQHQPQQHQPLQQQPVQHQPVPQQWADAEPTAMLPPITADFVAGYEAHAQPAHPQQAYPQPDYAQPDYAQPAYPQPDYAQPQPQPQPQAYLAEPLGPEATTAYPATPASLRETFAAAQPTGPAGAYAPAPPAPLEAQVGDGGSLRQAFAAADPTGPTGPAGPAAVPSAAAVPRRTGSPIIDPGLQPAAATAVLAVLLALAALPGRPALLVPVLLLQAGTAAGWFRLNGMWPARQGIALAALGGFAADAAMLAASGGTAPAVLAGTLGGFFLLVLILQIFRPSNPDERFYALTVSASATVVTVLAGCFLAAGTLTHHGWSSGAAVTVGALAAGAATLVSALPLPLPARAGFGAGAVAGLAAGALLGTVTGVGPGGGALLGLAAGACALVGRRVAGYDFPSRFVHLTAGVVLPLTCAAPAVFVVAHLLAG